MNVDYKVYEHQVAGSHHNSSKQLLRGSLGRVLKPYKVSANTKSNPEEKTAISFHIPDAAFDNEKDFYEKCNSDETLECLKNLIPRYFAEETILNGGIFTSHLVIEDVTYGFKRPCIADVKMGTTFDHPGSSLLKMQQNEVKYPSHKEIGWCIPGLVRHSMLSEECKKFGPDVGKTLTTEQTIEEFKYFLHSDGPNSCKIIEKFIGDVEEILSWFKGQRLFLFRSSSLLFTYDALPSHTNAENHSPRLKMIDFAHVLKAGEEEDSGYIFGLENILQLLRDCLAILK